jgi:hypothetical protein
MTYVFFVYGMVNFGIFTLGASREPQSEIASLRGFSGHWMIFYSAALAVLSSFRQTNTSTARCVNGHETRPAAVFCQVCGERVQRHDRIAG